MFGYIKMDNDAPKRIKDSFKKMYCLMCRALDKYYGLTSRMFVSEDVTLMMLLGSKENYLGSINKVRCIKTEQALKDILLEDFSKKYAALDICFVEAEILDKITDDNSFLAKIVKGFYSKAFKKVALDYPEMHKDVIDGYYVLAKEEKEGADMKRIGDVFSDFIYNIAKKHLGITDEDRLSYLTFLAKWLYFIDGIDDLTKDYKEHKYNPFIAYRSSKELINVHYDVIKDYVDYMYSCLHHIKPTTIELLTANRIVDFSIPARTYKVIKERG